jgi:hypothetical protein
MPHDDWLHGAWKRSREFTAGFTNYLNDRRKALSISIPLTHAGAVTAITAVSIP